MIGELLTVAQKKEQEIEKEKYDKVMLGMWVAQYVICSFLGQEPIDYKVFTEQEQEKDDKPKRSAEEIMADFAPYIQGGRK